MKATSADAGIGFGCVILMLVLSAAVGSVCWTYTLNTWLEFFGKEPAVKWWHGALIGFCPWIGQASVPAAAVTFILMLFL